MNLSNDDERLFRLVKRIMKPENEKDLRLCHIDYSRLLIAYWYCMYTG